MMEKREYTFVRGQAHSVSDARRVSADAMAAVRFASCRYAVIAEETAIEIDDATCRIAVGFSEGAPTHLFDQRLQTACHALGLTVSRGS
jgi:hypothetical protein